ncbi:MAG: hypothetical protein L3J66_04875 [Bacteroidales bacterium]|nr:hypothetical protein [Bacteroidales bacterium]
MDYNSFFSQIEKLFFSDDYQAVVNLWEENQHHFVLDYTKEYDGEILEAIKVSYYELGFVAKSLNLINEQFRLLPKLQISLPEKDKKLNYYFNDKMSILLEMNKLISYYRMKRQYLLIWGNKEYENHLTDIEILFYKKYVKFNNYLFFFLIVLVLLSFSANFLDYHVDKTIQMIYEILTWAGLVYVVVLKVFSKKAYGWFVKIFRRLFPPKSNYDTDYLKALIGKE